MKRTIPPRELVEAELDPDELAALQFLADGLEIDGLPWWAWSDLRRVANTLAGTVRARRIADIEGLSISRAREAASVEMGYSEGFLKACLRRIRRRIRDAA